MAIRAPDGANKEPLLSLSTDIGGSLACIKLTDCHLAGGALLLYLASLASRGYLSRAL